MTKGVGLEDESSLGLERGTEFTGLSTVSIRHTGELKGEVRIQCRVDREFYVLPRKKSRVLA